MADDLVKIWTKDFEVKRVWVIWFSGGTEGRGGGGGSIIANGVLDCLG